MNEICVKSGVGLNFSVIVHMHIGLHVCGKYADVVKACVSMPLSHEGI